MIATRPTAPTTWAVMLLAMAIPPLGVGRFLFPFDDITSRLLREAIFWIIAAALVVYVVKVEKQPLSSIGFRPPRIGSLAWAIAAAVAMTAVYLAIATLVIPALRIEGAKAAMRGLMATPLWFRFLLVLRAAVTEEIVYRAYPIERIEALTGSRLAAFAVSVFGFTAAHLNYWGWAQLLFVAPAGAILAGLYLWRRDIGCNMGAHFLTDALGFLTRP